MRKFLVSLTFVVAVYCLHAQRTMESIYSPNAPNNLIRFYQYKPPHYNTAPGKLPLIVSLHGAAQAGADDGSQLNNLLSYGLPQLVSQGAELEFKVRNNAGDSITEGFVMVAPQTNTSLVGDWPTYYIDEMINYAIAHLNADPNRVFLTGFSYGGNGVWKYAASSAAAAQRLAGITPAAPTPTSGNFCNIGANKVAVWAVHGTGDGSAYYGNTVNDVNATNNPACPASPGYPASPVVQAIDTLFAGQEHGIYMTTTYDVTNTAHFPNFFQWMLRVNKSLDPTTNLAPIPIIAGGPVLNLTAPVLIRNSFNNNSQRSFPILDGSASYDPDDIIMDYLWEQDGGPRTLLAGDGTTERIRQFPVVTVPPPQDEFTSTVGLPLGTYQFRLRVKDYLTSKVYNNSHTVFAPLIVNVVLPNGATHAAPAVDAGVDIVLGSSETYKTKIGVAEDLYNGNGINGALYNWQFVSGPQTPQVLNFDGGSVYTGNTQYVRFTNMDAAGTYVFRFTAGNNYGETASDLINIIRPGAALLPVSLLYIKAENAGSKNLVSWATSQEINSDRFDILRSADGISFTKIGTVPSKGGSITTTYSFDDATAPAGKSYYRLSQVDKDGKTTLSQIVTAVNNSSSRLYVEKYPNPVHDNLTVTASGTINGALQVVIADMQGKTLLQQQWQKDQSLIKKTLNVASLQNGVYQMIVTMGQEKQVSSFVKY